MTPRQLVERYGCPNETVPGDVFREMRQPLVYIWVRGDQILYVGKGASLSRPLSRDHHLMFGVRNGDSVLIFFRDSDDSALLLEHRMINAAKPAFNLRDEGRNEAAMPLHLRCKPGDLEALPESLLRERLAQAERDLVELERRASWLRSAIEWMRKRLTPTAAA